MISKPRGYRCTRIVILVDRIPVPRKAVRRQRAQALVCCEATCLQCVCGSYYIATGSKTTGDRQLSNTATISIVVKQNSDAAFTGGGGGALYFDGYDDFAQARMKVCKREEEGKG